MKRNKFNIIVLFLFLISQVGWAQLENANWYFGEHAGLNFENTTTVLTDGETTNENNQTATISDSNGNLLFYTDGHTVWNTNNQIMENGNGTLNGFRPFIVPYPNHINKYFVITSNLQDPLSEDVNFYYSVIDINENGGLGKVTQVSIDLGITAVKNILISKHSDMTSYWFITMQNGFFYNYKIDENGFSNTPVISNDYLPIGLSNSLAITKDNNKLAFHSMDYTVGGVKKGKKEKKTTCYLSISDIGLFDIDNTTGLITLVNCSFGLEYPLSMAFSEDGNMLYLAGIYSFSNLYWMPKLSQFNINTMLITQEYTLNDDVAFYNEINKPPSPTVSRAINGKIYVTKAPVYLDVPPFNAISQDINHLSVVNNPNIQGTNCNFVLNQVDLFSNNTTKLPKLVHVHENSCVQNLTISQNVNSGQTDIQESSNTITATNTIFSGATAEYDAGTTVYLKPNFHAKNGSTFRAFIEGCSISKAKNNNYLSKEIEVSKTEVIEFIKIYPNPTKDFATIKSAKEVSNWVITSSYGKTYFTGNNTEIIDMRNLPKGIYFLKAILTNGKIVNKKIIKN